MCLSVSLPQLLMLLLSALAALLLSSPLSMGFHCQPTLGQMHAHAGSSGLGWIHRLSFRPVLKAAAHGRGRKLGSDYLLPGRKAPAAIQSQQQVDAAKRDIIPGFVATDTQRMLQSYPPPVVPPGYKPHHSFPSAEHPGALAVGCALGAQGVHSLGLCTCSSFCATATDLLPA